MITVKPVTTKKELASFIDFPHKLFEGDNNYVPELHIAQRDVLTPGKHPFHNHSSMQLFLAYDENAVIKGRIAAIFNNNHNAFKHVTDGFFGFHLRTDFEFSSPKRVKFIGYQFFANGSVINGPNVP